MNPATNQPEVGRRPIDLLTPEARKALRNSRRAFRRSSTARDRIGKTEGRLREWEGRVLARNLKPRKWKSLREEGLTLLADSGGVLLQVRQVEQLGLKLLRVGMESLHDGARESGSDQALRAYDLLGRCERLRAGELELLDATLAETHGILNLPDSPAPDQVLRSLEKRRQYVSKLDARQKEAEHLELQAIEVLTGTTIKPVAGGQKGEKSMPRRKKPAAPEKEPPAVAEDVEPTSPEEPVLDQPVLGPLDEVSADFRRTADRLDSVRLEVEGRLAGLIERLEVNHAAALEDEALRRGELEEQLDQLRAERKEVEARVAAAENAAGELRDRMKGLEEEVATERQEIAAERKALAARTAAAEQERDEALVLVTSLTRRLKTPGVEAESEEE